MPKSCPVCGTADSTCTGHAPATTSFVEIGEPKMPEPAIGDYVVTNTDRRGRVSTYTARLNEADAARLGAVPADQAGAEERPAARNKRRTVKDA